jgi:hypothetical protein
MNSAALEQALRDAGVPCRVEAYERVAVVQPDREIDFTAAALRARVEEAARAHGFTHVAVELPDSPQGAAVPRG